MKIKLITTGKSQNRNFCIPNVSWKPTDMIFEKYYGFQLLNYLTHGTDEECHQELLNDFKIIFYYPTNNKFDLESLVK